MSEDRFAIAKSNKDVATEIVEILNDYTNKMLVDENSIKSVPLSPNYCFKILWNDVWHNVVISRQ